MATSDRRAISPAGSPADVFDRLSTPGPPTGTRRLFGTACVLGAASCLSEYLRAAPDLDAPARQFFDLQQVVVEAAWQTSTARDAARLGLAKPS